MTFNKILRKIRYGRYKVKKSARAKDNLIILNGTRRTRGFTCFRDETIMAIINEINISRESAEFIFDYSYDNKYDSNYENILDRVVSLTNFVCNIYRLNNLEVIQKNVLDNYISSKKNIPNRNGSEIE